MKNKRDVFAEPPPEWLLRLVDKLRERMSDSVVLPPLRDFERCEDFETLQHDICAFIQRRNLARIEAVDIGAALKAQITAAGATVLKLHENRVPSSDTRWYAAEEASEEASEEAYSEWRSVEKEAPESAESTSLLMWSVAWTVESMAEAAAWLVTEAAWSTARAARLARVAQSGWTAEAAEAEAAEYDAIGQELLRLLGGEDT